MKEEIKISGRLQPSRYPLSVCQQTDAFGIMRGMENPDVNEVSGLC